MYTKEVYTRQHRVTIEAAMKVFLLKDVEKVGVNGEIITVTEGYGRNFLLPRRLAVEITSDNEAQYRAKMRTVEKRKEVIETQTSLLAARISTLKLTIKKKMHDDGKTYGAVSQTEIADALKEHGVTVGKNQVIIDKSIKAQGNYEVEIKLSSRLKPRIKVVIVPE